MKDRTLDTTWHARAACRNVDPELFYADDDETRTSRVSRSSAAKAVCATCPVIAQCREYGLRERELYGVWGGLTSGDRDAILYLQVGKITAEQLPTVDGVTLTRAEMRSYVARVDTTGGYRACWTWQGSTSGKARGEQYGRFRVARDGKARWLRVNRIALALWLGRDLQGVARHVTCDNSLCANGAHLADGTQAQNVADMVARGRARNGATGALAVEVGEELAQLVLDGAMTPSLMRDGVSHQVRAEVITRLNRCGISDHRIARATGWDEAAIRKVRKRLDLPIASTNTRQDVPA